jgi:hypothetical protein
MPRKSANAKLPEISVLKIDKDCHPDREWLPDYVRIVRKAAALKSVQVIRVRMCKSRVKGCHFYLDIEPSVSAEKANELQFLMGDDCKRVDFNRARIRSGFSEWNKLFEKENRRLRVLYRSQETGDA